MARLRRVKWRDIWYLMGTIPVLLGQWPAVKARIEEIASDDAIMAPFVSLVDQMRDRFTKK